MNPEKTHLCFRDVITREPLLQPPLARPCAAMVLQFDERVTRDLAFLNDLSAECTLRRGGAHKLVAD